ncbi:hypothetical protein GBAR_LOCUS18004 [Geodia barretti]|uniref:Uncharacterized protein n=1 Tax=Geodia barretti TaxID=519541 RepID=A0AA35WT26_GEOBA|nr:hypothetical protein GBAR_LOCUS18004 [Geodia barretti]
MNPVLIELWIQSTSASTTPHEVKDYVSDAVGLWISDTLECSDKVWVMCRYSAPLGQNGAIEKVAGKGYQNGQSV